MALHISSIVGAKTYVNRGILAALLEAKLDRLVVLVETVVDSAAKRDRDRELLTHAVYAASPG